MATVQQLHDRLVDVVDALDDEVRKNATAIAGLDDALDNKMPKPTTNSKAGMPFLVGGVGSNTYPQVGVKDGLQLSDDMVLTVKPATTSTIGGVKVGNGLSVTADGTISSPTNALFAGGINLLPKYGSGTITFAKVGRIVCVNIIDKVTTEEIIGASSSQTMTEAFTPSYTPLYPSIGSVVFETNPAITGWLYIASNSTVLRLGVVSGFTLPAGTKYHGNITYISAQ